MAACAHVPSPGEVKTAVVDCTKADAPAIAAVVAQLGAQATLAALGAGAIDWSALESAAWAQTKVVGGCALAQLAVAIASTKASAPAPQALLAGPSPADDAAAALHRFEARAGMTFRASGS